VEAVKRIIRHYRRPYRFATLGIAFLLAGAFWWELREAARRRNVSIGAPRWLVVKRDIAPGRLIDLGDLGFELASDAHRNDTSLLTDQDLSRLKNMRSRGPLKKGQTLKRADLVSSAGLSPDVPRGRRAYLFQFEDPVPARSGEWVDIYFNPADSGQNSWVLLEAIKVLKANAEGEVVLALTVDEIQEMEKGKQKGKLTLALRNPDEPNPLVEGLTKTSRFKKRPVIGRPRRIDIQSESE
jgi:Flp pilus assembly protein CpaB